MEKVKTAFPPIVNNDSRILLLGTMPGERSLILNQYYGHAGNQFWKIIFSLFEHPFTTDYAVRKQLLLNNGVALWDVLKHCQGKGASDNAIKNEVPNDFDAFYKQYPSIKNVFLTSKKADYFYNKYVGKEAQRNYYLLPSPSRANTWKSVQEKVMEWQEILKL
jgi:hypoxanthine-DNA glycosylase